MRAEELTGHEILDVEKVLGTTFAQAAEDGNLMVGYAIFWVARRRDDPTFTYDQALDESLETVSKAIEDLGDQVPKAAGGNGAPSPVSAGSGR